MKAPDRSLLPNEIHLLKISAGAAGGLRSLIDVVIGVP